MKPENKFRNWFQLKMREYMLKQYPSLRVRVQKHADAVTAGIPDIDLSIAGITMWLEVKHLESCVKGRTLHVTPLQVATLNSIAQAGVFSGLLVGLALGPRQGYAVALYSAVPTLAVRDDFGRWETVVDTLVAHAKASSQWSAETFAALPSIYRPGYVTLPDDGYVDEGC